MIPDVQRQRWQPLLFMGLFSCWLLFGVIGWMWLASGQRQVAAQALQQQASQQRVLLRNLLEEMQLSGAQLLRSLEGASAADDVPAQPYLLNYRRQFPQPFQLALLAPNPAAGRQLEVLAMTASQAGARLLPAQDLSRQPAVAAVLPALQAGKPQLLLWQRREPEQWLLLLPGAKGMVLALWLQPQQLLPPSGDTAAPQMQLSLSPLAPPQVQEAGTLHVQQAMHSGEFLLTLTVWQRWQLSDVISWRLVQWLLFMALTGWLGWQAWRFGRGLSRRMRQIRQMQWQWLAHAEALAPVSAQGALATLERQVQQLPAGQGLRVWWVHGKGMRRRRLSVENALFRLETHLMRTPVAGVQIMRLRHGGILLVLAGDAARLAEDEPVLSSWLTSEMGGRVDEASLLWLCFDIRDGVQALEQALVEWQPQQPEPVLPR